MGFFSDLDVVQEAPKAADKKGFFSDLGEENPKFAFPSIGLGKKVAPNSKVDEMKRTLGRHAKTVGTTVAGLPGDIVSGLASGSNWIAGKVPGGKPKSEEEMKGIVENPLTSQSLSRLVEEHFPSLAPKNPQEKQEEENLSLITSLLTPLPAGKAKALDPRRLSKTFKAGKALGLTEKEIVPLLHGDATQAVLGKIAKGTKNTQNALGLVKNRLDDVRETLTTKSKGKFLGEAAENKLLDGMRSVQSKLQSTLKPSPDKQAAIDFIQQASDNLMNKPATLDHLMNFIHDINQSVNWNAVKGGKKALAALKQPVLEAIRETSPALGKKFEGYQHLYSKMKGFEKAVGVPKIAQFMADSNAAKLLTYLAFGGVGKLLSGVGGLKTIGATIAARSISSRLLTDPKWQNLHRKLLSAIQNQSFSQVPKLLQVIKNRTKQEFPEEYEEIDWDNLLKEA